MPSTHIMLLGSSIADAAFISEALSTRKGKLGKVR